MSRFLIILCGCFYLSRPVLAWNAEGHMVVAQIAYNHLDPEVKAKCDALLTNSIYHSSSINSNFVTAACWADDIKSFTSAYSTWHYIDLYFSLDGTSTNGLTPPPTNVVWAINQCIATLQDSTATPSNQAVALRFLLHFVGDVQQPLHCTSAVSASRTNGDAGGNSFSLNGNWSNLHSLWDSGGGYLSDFISRPLDATDPTLSNKVADVEAAYPYTTSIGTIPDPMDWAIEGRGLAQTVSYVGITAGSTPSVSYTNTAQATTKQRMAIGGQRLAKLLNTIFVTNAPTLASATLTNGNFSFKWSAVPGRIYRVQWKQQPNDAVWNDLTDLTASTNSLTFIDSTTQTQRFYRAIVVN
jgi:hypothetical protein